MNKYIGDKEYLNELLSKCHIDYSREIKSKIILRVYIVITICIYFLFLLIVADEQMIQDITICIFGHTFSLVLSAMFTSPVMGVVWLLVKNVGGGNTKQNDKTLESMYNSIAKFRLKECIINVYNNSIIQWKEFDSVQLNEFIINNINEIHKYEQATVFYEEYLENAQIDLIKYLKNSSVLTSKNVKVIQHIFDLIAAKYNQCQNYKIIKFRICCTSQVDKKYYEKIMTLSINEINKIVEQREREQREREQREREQREREQREREQREREQREREQREREQREREQRERERYRDNNNELDNALSLYMLHLPFTLDELKRKRRILLKAFHPDSNNVNSGEETIQINNAYKVLEKYASK